MNPEPARNMLTRTVTAMLGAAAFGSALAFALHFALGGSPGGKVDSHRPPDVPPVEENGAPEDAPANPQP